MAPVAPAARPGALERRFSDVGKAGRPTRCQHGGVPGAPDPAPGLGPGAPGPGPGPGPGAPDTGPGAPDPDPDPDPDQARVTVRVAGHVQGVGFRWWTRARALELGLVGSATNLPDGRVEVVAEGGRDACVRLAELLRGPGAPGRVSRVGCWWSDSRGGLTGFLER